MFLAQMRMTHLLKKFCSLMANSDDEDEFSIGLKAPITASKLLQNYKNMTKKCHWDENPLKWWKKNSNLYPEVSVLAKKYLSIVATSVPFFVMLFFISDLILFFFILFELNNS